MNIDLEKFVETSKYTFENHPDPIFIKNLQKEFVYINKEYLKLNKHLNTELVGKNNSEIFNEEKADRYNRMDEKVIQHQKTLKYETDVETENGPKYYVAVKSPIFNTNNELIGILGTARNIDNQIELRKELKSNIQFLVTLMDTVPYPIFIKNREGIYIKVNKAFAEDRNRTIENIEGKTDYDIFDQDAAEFFIMKDQKVYETGKRTIYIRRVENSNKKSLTTKEPLLNEDGEIIGVVGIVNSFLDLEEVKDDLIRKEKIESIGQLAGGIAHDLNNILTSIVGMSNVLLLEEEDEDKRSDLKVIYNSSIKASKLIDKLLTFAKKDIGTTELIDINEIVSDIISLVIGNYYSNFTIETDYSPHSLEIMGDNVQISQLVMNIIINAFEAMEFRGKIFITTRLSQLDTDTSDYIISPSNFDGGEYAQLIVRDQGPGITSDKLDKIFEPYFTTKEYGSGLGLSIVYGVVTAHDGLLKIISNDSGTTFEISLPIASSDTKDQSKNKPVDIPQLDGKILVIDDKKEITNLITSMFERVDIETISTTDPIKGIEIFKNSRNEISKVFLDVKMPKMNGKEVYYELKKIDPEVEIIIITGYGEKDIINELKDQGVKTIVKKPFTFDELVKKL